MTGYFAVWLAAVLCRDVWPKNLRVQMGTSVLLIERHYNDLEPVNANDQLRGEDTLPLMEAGTVVDEAYQSKKLKIRSAV